jgi:hypothetical protein
MAGRQSGENNERGNLASVPNPMSSAARFWICDSRSHPGSRSASDWLPVSMAAANLSCASSDRLSGHWKPERHEAVWRTVAVGKGSWRNLAAVPESVSGTACVDDEHFATRRICSGSASVGSRTFASADAIGFTIPEATASSPRTCRDWNRKVCVSAGSSVSVPRSDRGLGQ